jgi:hypothetical protein
MESAMVGLAIAQTGESRHRDKTFGDTPSGLSTR